ncbi:MAG: hypothetical protein NTZ17_04140 [Phycisphaerae bacterium]|nr:hypothetical protein [Phycisphaerae bacterium]
MVLQTWQVIVVALAGWLNRQQQDVVGFLTEENRVLREQLGGKRGFGSPMTSVVGLPPRARLWAGDSLGSCVRL